MKAHDFKLCCCFSLPVSVCIDANFILAYPTIGSYISRMATNYSFATVYKGRHIKEMLVINETALVSVRLQLLEMSSIITPNQTILNVCTRYSFQRAFLGKYGDFYRSSIMKKFSMVIACKQNCFDF